jgi:hypothetical protein
VYIIDRSRARSDEMNRIIFVDQMTDYREIRIHDDGIVETLYNGNQTGKFFLDTETCADIMFSNTEEEAFGIIENIKE